MPSRQQLKQLQLALISAFPSKSLLERLLYFELERNLNEITRDSDLQEIVFKLIQTAESQEWLIDLVRAARKENSGNLQLKAIALELLSPETSSISKPSPSVSATVAKPKQEQHLLKSISNITAEFDVFLCHNSEDRDAIIAVGLNKFFCYIPHLHKRSHPKPPLNTQSSPWIICRSLRTPNPLLNTQSSPLMTKKKKVQAPKFIYGR